LEYNISKNVGFSQRSEAIVIVVTLANIEICCVKHLQIDSFL
jgi:hypothetical protein